jgi:hypothetical protein
MVRIQEECDNFAAGTISIGSQTIWNFELEKKIAAI